MSYVQSGTTWVDQAARLRELASRNQAARPAALTIAVTSGKGGVGKTNVAINLAICLAARGLKVSLLDFDMGLANADLLLNTNSPYNLSHVISGRRTIREIGTVTTGNIFFIPGASGVERLADLGELERQHLFEQMQWLGETSDVVVMDCAAGISRNVMAFSLAADITLLVTTPEPTAMADAYAVIKVTTQHRAHGVIRVLVNSVESRAEARGVYQRLDSVARRFLNFSVADGGYIVQDTHVEQAVRQRCPFVVRYPRCPASACMSAVAAGFVDVRRPLNRSADFFRRILGLFA
jgi:flagellar biosynthesis protein FlhG